MVVTAQDLRAASIDLPLFVGGAALTRKFTATRIAPEYGGLTLYARDAMEGLDLANQLFSAVTRDGLVERVRAEQAALAVGTPTGGESARPVQAPERPRARLERIPVPTPPDLESHLLRDVPLTHIYPYLNLQMLYGKHLGLRGLVERLLASRDPKALELHETVERLKHDAVTQRLLRAHGVYRWYRARAAGEAVIVFDPAGRALARFEFTRQTEGERLCIADYVRNAVEVCLTLSDATCREGGRVAPERTIGE